MEFIVVFLVSLLLLLLLVVSMLFGRPPTYRPDKKSTYLLISALCDGSSDSDRWLLFISIPIVHDSGLEKIRLQCYELELQAEMNKEVCFGAGGYRYNPAGMRYLEKIRDELKSLIEGEPTFRSF